VRPGISTISSYYFSVAGEKSEILRFAQNDRIEKAD
jgi:hypothetical protein